MKEDKLTNSLIKHFKNREGDRPTDHDKVVVEPEAHYNYYGTRGVADLFVRCYELEGYPPLDIVFEIKSSPTSANEVIRQVKKMEKTFFMDERRSPGDSVIFELCFTPEEDNLRHVAENFEMYVSVRPEINVTMRHPDDITPIILHLANEKDMDFLDYVESNNPKIFELFEKWHLPEVFQRWRPR